MNKPLVLLFVLAFSLIPFANALSLATNSSVFESGASIPVTFTYTANTYVQVAGTDTNGNPIILSRITPSSGSARVYVTYDYTGSAQVQIVDATSPDTVLDSLSITVVSYFIIETPQPNTTIVFSDGYIGPPNYRIYMLIIAGGTYGYRSGSELWLDILVTIPELNLYDYPRYMTYDVTTGAFVGPQLYFDVPVEYQNYTGPMTITVTAPILGKSASVTVNVVATASDYPILV